MDWKKNWIVEIDLLMDHNKSSDSAYSPANIHTNRHTERRWRSQFDDDGRDGNKTQLFGLPLSASPSQCLQHQNSMSVLCVCLPPFHTVGAWCSTCTCDATCRTTNQLSLLFVRGHSQPSPPFLTLPETLLFLELFPLYTVLSYETWTNLLSYYYY